MGLVAFFIIYELSIVLFVIELKSNDLLCIDPQNYSGTRLFIKTLISVSASFLFYIFIKWSIFALILEAFFRLSA